MEVLVEPHKISKEVLLKVAEGIISKYETRQIDNIFTFLQDSNQALQEMKLYCHTLSQLYLESGKESTHLFSYYHAQNFRILDFLLKTVQKTYNKNQVSSSPASQPAHCSNCQHLIHQRNVRNMQREILDYHRYSAQMLDQNLKWEPQQDNYEEEEETVCSEGYFRKKMLAIQKKIEDRQSNILECIVNFEQLRSSLTGEMQRRESVGDVNAFNMREHLQAVTQNFMTTLRKIELKINSLRRHHPPNHEKETQTISYSQETARQTPFADTLKMPMRSQLNFKKVSNLNNKSQETAKKTENQLNALKIKVQALESQNKKLREQVFTQKMKNRNERTAKNIQRQEEKNKIQRDCISKQILLIDNLQSIFCESADFGSQFTTTLQQNFKDNEIYLSKQETALPIIKQIFQKTLERYTNLKSSMLVNLQKRLSLKDQEECVDLKRNRSKKQSMRMQMQSQGRETRCSNLNKAHQNTFQIISVFNMKLIGQKHQYSMSTITQSTTKTTLKDAAHPQHQKKKKLAKLSIFSDLKQQNQKSKPIIKQTPKQRQKTQFSPEPLSQNYIASNIASSKIFKKSNFRRNKSQDDINSSQKKKQTEFVFKPKEQEIDEQVVRSFLMLNQLRRVKQSQNQLNFRQRSRNILENQANVKIQRQKIVLTLDELYYLTLLFSKFARVRLGNIHIYNQIREWIFSSSNIKPFQESGQSLIMRRIVSQIISRHRQCASNTLCHHLTDFLEAIQRILTDSEWKVVESAKHTIIQ